MTLKETHLQIVRQGAPKGGGGGRGWEVSITKQLRVEVLSLETLENNTSSLSLSLDMHACLSLGALFCFSYCLHVMDKYYPTLRHSS